MDGKIKLVILLFILVVLSVSVTTIYNSDSDSFQVALDAATKEAIDKGEFVAPEGVTFVESKDCEGTQWIKQKECSLNGSPMDGTEGSCGPGKEIWILDPSHSSFKPATGDGKCEPQERDCSVECPKPCEGDTWIDTGKCVRKEYDTRGNMIETILDGTEGKCGEGITQLNLDTTASDYKPAVGKGSCPISKGGYCNVPCPEPEPPRCNSYTGWVENTGLGCVVAENSQIKVACGQKGKKMFFNVATNPRECPELVIWEDCTAGPCPIDCVGSWSDWSDPKSDEPCGVQPYKERTFTITTQAQHGGNECDYPHNDTQRVNSGTAEPCCIEHGDWAMVGACNTDGTAKYTQRVDENKVGGCPLSAKAKIMACCYQSNVWVDTTTCNSVGRKTQEQATINCQDIVKTRQVNCPYVGPWISIGACTPEGQQYYRRDVVNSNETTTKSEDCCTIPDENAWVKKGRCGEYKANKQAYSRPTSGICTESDTTKYEYCRNCVSKEVKSNSNFCQKISDSKAILFTAWKSKIITPASGTGDCLSPFPKNYVNFSTDNIDCTNASGNKYTFGDFRSRGANSFQGIWRWESAYDYAHVDQLVKANGGWTQ